ncbi:uromodulin [Nematostella vectensis]|uniref:uromodulin n=1 Tax=Nematostella vectensis TaxID=45351 RepID=UPI0020777E64|nr:uromodulin [Nematostella vectensis]
MAKSRFRFLVLLANMQFLLGDFITKRFYSIQENKKQEIQSDYLLEETFVTGLFTCAHLCTRNTECRSINFEKESLGEKKDGKLCQLLKDGILTKLIQDINFDYFSVESPCNDIECQNNGTCFATDTDYGCTCLPEFTGSRCETPVECLTYRNLSEANRHTQASQVGKYCDSSAIITRNQWYRFVGAAGIHMLDYCPKTKCNTDFQIFLTDSQPKRGDIRVTRRYSIQGNNRCDLWPGSVKATHCNEFIVYQLHPVNCYIRYCGAG